MGTTSRISGLIVEFGWVGLGQFLAVACSLLLVRILTGFLSQPEFGSLALALTFAQLANQTVLGGLSNGIGRFYPVACEEKQLASYFRTCRDLTLIAAAITLGAGLVILLTFKISDQDRHLDIFLPATVLSITTGLNSVFNGIQNAARRRSTVAMLSGLEGALKIGFCAALLTFAGGNSFWALAGLSLASATTTLFQYISLRPLIPKERSPAALHEKRQWMRMVISFSWPFSVWGVFTWLHLSSDRWCLDFCRDATEVAIYTVTYQLGFSPMIMVTGLLMSLLGPIFYQRAGTGKELSRIRQTNQLVTQTSVFALLATATSVLFCLLLHRQIYQAFTAPSYHSQSDLLPVAVAAGGLFATGQFLSLKPLAQMTPKKILGIKIGTAVTGILFNLVGAYELGARGVLVSLLCFAMLYAILMARVSTTPIETDPALHAESTSTLKPTQPSP